MKSVAFPIDTEQKHYEIHGYKAFDKDLKCRDHQFEVGETYIQPLPPILQKRGFHFETNPLFVKMFPPYDGDSCRYAKILAKGVIQRDSKKWVTNHITILEELTEPEYFAQVTVEHCQEAISLFGTELFPYIAEKRTDLLSKDICAMAIRKNPLNLEFIPSELQTLELCKLALRLPGFINHPLIFRYCVLPDEEDREELIRYLLRINGRCLSFVLHKTREFCEIAVKQSGYALKFVPEAEKSHELCLEAMTVNDPFTIASYIPKQLMRNPIFQKNLVRKIGAIGVAVLDEQFRTRELWELAVKTNGESLVHVPESMQSCTKLMYMAVRSNGQVVEHIIDRVLAIPDLQIQTKILRAAVRQTHLALRFIPLKHRTYQIYLDHASHGNFTFLYEETFPKEYLTTAMMLAIAKKTDNIGSSWIRQLCENQEIEVAVKCNPRILEKVEHKYLTQELCLIAVNKSGFALNYIPQPFRTKEVVEAAIRQNSKVVASRNFSGGL